MIGATAFATPELALDEPEAKQLAGAITEVSRHYAINVDEKTMAWGQLFIAIGMIYGTRLIAVRTRKKTEAKKRASEPRAANIADFPKPKDAPPSPQATMGYTGLTGNIPE